MSVNSNNSRCKTNYLIYLQSGYLHDIANKVKQGHSQPLADGRAHSFWPHAHANF